MLFKIFSIKCLDAVVFNHAVWGHGLLSTESTALHALVFNNIWENVGTFYATKRKTHAKKSSNILIFSILTAYAKLIVVHFDKLKIDIINLQSIMQ